MVNICESLINVVSWNKRKMLKVSTRSRTLGPKGKWPGMGTTRLPIADVAPPANRRDLTHAIRYLLGTW